VFYSIFCPFVQLLDLFSLENGSPKLGESSKAPGASLATALKTLPELWEHTDYEEEYDLTNFVKNLRS
jgi:hypothetical protein